VGGYLEKRRGIKTPQLFLNNDKMNIEIIQEGGTQGSRSAEIYLA
jgi:hypothetical protein